MGWGEFLKIDWVSGECRIFKGVIGGGLVSIWSFESEGIS